MSNIKIYFIKFTYLFLLAEQLKDAFSNQKKNSSDEFLVEKKSPLVMPPNYGELPVPEANLNNSNQNKDKNKIQNLLLNTDNKFLENKNNSSNQNLEKSILNKIKKN